MKHSTSQLTGPQDIAAALSAGEPVSLLLVRKGTLSDDAKAVVEQAKAAGIPLRMESVNDLRRMGRGTQDSEVLALVGRHPEHDLKALMASDGAVWLVVGAAYPANVGVTIRTVEVSGAAGLVIDGEFTRKMKHLAMRVAMRADRFMPVLWDASVHAISEAKAAGRPIVALEDSGDKTPWDVDLSGNPLIVVGGERDGIAPDVLRQCDAVVRIPMPGFIGSYNVQIAVSMVAAERLRQLA